MSYIPFADAEDFERVQECVLDCLSGAMAAGTITVSFDHAAGSRRATLNRLAMDIASAVARSDLSVSVTGDISDLPEVDVERVA